VLTLSLVDVVLLAAQRVLNASRLARQTPPLLQLSSLEAAAVYFMLALIVGGALLWLRKARVVIPRALWSVALASLGFLLIRAVVVVAAESGPRDRARMVLSAARVAAATEAIQEYWGDTRTLPMALADVIPDEEARKDGWGFWLSYSKADDASGYEIQAVGVPEEVRRKYADKWPVEVVARVGGTR
jgi:hypothetical protein